MGGPVRSSRPDVQHTTGCPAWPPPSARGHDSVHTDARVTPLGSDVEREAQVDVGGGVAPANAPALQRRLEDHHRDVHRVDGNLSEPLDKAPVEVALGIGGAAGERGDLDQRVAIGAPGRDLEVLGLVVDDSLVRSSSGIRNASISAAWTA